LELVAEADGNNRILLEEAHAVVDFVLLRQDVGLNRGVAGDSATVRAIGVAHVSSQTQCGFGRALEGDAELNRNAEVFGRLARNQVAPANRGHGRGLVELDVSVAGDGNTGVAKITRPAQA